MIELDDVTIRCGGFALEHLRAAWRAGEYAVLMGGTGQGKTTIVEAICGLRPIAAGHIRLQGVDVTHARPADRSVGYVPQDLALFPMKTVREHLEFALRLRRRSEAAIRERVGEMAGLLGIEALLDRDVRHLSGGEAQRTALGRALSFQPQILLLDEPLNALDEPTRDRLCELLRSLQRRLRLTVLHITHSHAEAKQVADRVFRLEDGAIREIAPTSVDQ
jgi:ABC-type sugar transport system ATPase subunit